MMAKIHLRHLSLTCTQCGTGGMSAPEKKLNPSLWKLRMLQIYIEHVLWRNFWKKPVFIVHKFQDDWRTWMVLTHWRWCQMTWKMTRKIVYKFQDDWTCRSQSRLYLSSKTPAGVLEDIDVPDTLGDGVKWLERWPETLCVNFKMIGHV